MKEERTVKLITEDDYDTRFNSLDELKEPDEEFQELNGYPGYYISNYGKIVSTKCTPGKFKIMKPDTTNNRYPDTKIIHNNTQKHIIVHIQVAKQFIPVPAKFLEKGYTNDILEVNHIDGNKYNCHVSNLEWITPKVNKIFSGAAQKDIWDANSISIFAPDGSYIHSFTSIQSALEFFKVNNNEIRAEIYNALNSTTDMVLGVRWVTYLKEHQPGYNLLKDDPRFIDPNRVEFDFNIYQRPIYQINLLTDKVIYKYNSTCEAALTFQKYTGQVNTLGAISSFNENNFSIAYGFKWMYADIYDYYHQTDSNN